MSENTHLSGDAGNMIRAWTNLQRQLWQCWPGTGAGQTGRSPDDAFTRSMEISEGMVDCLFRAQSEWNRIYFSTMHLGDSPLPTLWTEWQKQAEYIVGGWSMAQRGAAKAWFAALRQLRPDQPSVPPDQPKGVIDAWRDAAWKAWEIQNAWMRILSAPAKRTAQTAPDVAENGGEASEESMEAAAR